MSKVKLEYIWLDGNQKDPALRSKTKILDRYEVFSLGYVINPESLPEWGFDGSSTKQAEGNFSDCVLKPVHVIQDYGRAGKPTDYLVMCEVYNPDGTSHKTNKRSLIKENEESELWFGFEQEYVFMDPDTDKPLGFPKQGYPAPQGPYYCGVGNVNVKSREIVEEHLNICLRSGLDITGVNGEVMIGQWEYQLLSQKGAKIAADELWLSRFILMRLCEKYGVNVELHPKPIVGDWNGSGMHTNFSTYKMREEGIDLKKVEEVFDKNHRSNIKEYGAYNEFRLTGLHETQSIDKFSIGNSDRGASIRVPVSVHTSDDKKGYLEDRRPASNADPYRVVKVIVDNMNEVEGWELEE